MGLTTFSKVKLLIVLTMLASMLNFASAKKLALIIGISTYTNTITLQNPENDAIDLATILEGDLGFEVTVGLELSTKAEIENLLENFIQQITPDDYVVFYFSGHGAQIDGGNYLIPSQASFDNITELKQASIEVNSILNRLHIDESQSTILILDACRNLPNIPDNLFQNQGLSKQNIGADFELDKNTFVVFSAESGKLASDGRPGDRNSPFVQVLKKELAFLPKDNTYGIRKLFQERIRPQVYSLTKKKQFPDIIDNLVNDVFLQKETAQDLVKLIFEGTPSNVKVSIDNREIENLNFVELDVGEYLIKIEKDGYEAYETKINIDSSLISKNISYELALMKTELNIITEPSLAGVFKTSDNSIIGITPIENNSDLAPGTYEIKIELGGYQEIIRTIELIPGKPITLSEKLNKLDGLVDIESQPTGAKVFFKDEEIGITPFTYQRPEGEYNFIFELEGYKKEFQTVPFYSGQTTTFNQVLEISQAPGRIILKEVFPKDAAIRLDGGFKGLGTAANGNLNNIPLGERTVTVTKEGYEDARIVLLVEAGEEYPLDFNLTPKKAILKIETVPSVEAMVYIDELPIASLPSFEEQLEHGEYTIKLIADGYESHQQLVDLKMGEVLPLSIPLKAKVTVGILDIRSNPPGAAVYFNNDDEFTAITPFTIKKTEGIYNIKFNKFGYTELTITHNVIAGQDETINEVLVSEKETTTIDVKTNPQNVRVFIDGGYVGLTNFEKPIPIEPGKHTIKFQLPDFTEQIEVEVLDGVPLLVEKDFTKLKVDFKLYPDFAELYIDDIRQESRSLELNEGIYSVRVSSEGYETQEKELVVQKNRENIVTVTLASQRALLTVKTNTENAKIIIDNVPLTVNPVELDAGAYRVIASASGYDTVEKTVVLLPGKPSTVELNLEQLLGKLVLDTDQSLYEVKIQGDNNTYNTQRVFKLAEGSYKVTVRAPNMIEQSFIANVVAGEDFLQRIEFQPQEALVFYELIPQTAKVFINGLQFKENPIKVLPGKYTFEFRQEGYDSQQQTITLSVGEQYDFEEIELQLLPQESAQNIGLEAKPVLITNQVEQEIKESTSSTSLCSSDKNLACFNLTSNYDNTKVEIIDLIGGFSKEIVLMRGSPIEISVSPAYYEFYVSTLSTDSEYLIGIDIIQGGYEDITIEGLFDDLSDTLAVGVYSENGILYPLLISNTDMDITIEVPNGEILSKSLKTNNYLVLESEEIQDGTYTFIDELGQSISHNLKTFGILSPVSALRIGYVSDLSSHVAQWQGEGKNFGAKLFKANYLLAEMRTDKRLLLLGELSSGDYQLCVVAMSFFEGPKRAETAPETVYASQRCTNFKVADIPTNNSGGTSNTTGNDSGSDTTDPVFIPPDR